MIFKTGLNLFLFFFAGCVLLSCGDRYETIHRENVVPGKVNTKQDTIIKDTVQNFYFSRLTKPASCGMQFIFKIPENLQQKAVCIVFKGRARTNYAYSNASISFMALSKNGDQLFWNSVKLRNIFIGINNWSSFRDSISFPKDFFGKKYTVITGFPFLGDSPSENFDIDTMNVVIR